VERHARRGEAIVLAEDLLGDCARVVFRERREFHRGFDSRATRLAGGIAAGVVPDGPAYAAGMRDGMRILRLEGGTAGDSATELVYRVSDEAGERMIRYLPEGKKVHRVQQIELTAEGAEQEAACKARLGGKS
jgi:predicted metalloprotease with PDZ domain